MSLMSVQPARGSRAIRAAVLASALGAAAVLGTACAKADEVGDRDASMFDPGDLSCIGDETTLRDAAQMVEFPIFLAHSPLASTESIERVLKCSSDQVEVDYESGVLVTTGVSHLEDPVMEWKTLAEEYAEFSTGTVRGVQASLADPEKGAIGGVDLVEGDVRITVTGNGSIPLNDLIEVAESLEPIRI
jgi:hypothetical protein